MENKALVDKVEEDGRLLDRMRTEFQSNDEQIRVHERNSLKLRDQLDKTEKELLSSTEKITSLDNTNRNLLREIGDLRKEIRLRKESNAADELVEENDDLRGRIEKLEDAKEQLDTEKRRLESEKMELVRSRDMLAGQLVQASSVLEEHHRCPYEAQEKDERITQLEIEVDELKLLLDQLGPFQQTSFNGIQEDVGGKTLLGEVEDARLDAEVQKGKLSQKNSQLLKANSMLLQQHNQMRNQINFLTQQQSTRTSGVSELVQQSLHQLKGELEQTLTKSRTELPNLPSVPSELPTQPAAESKELIDLLRLQIFELASENDTLKREMSTIRLLRLTDVEKLQNVEAMLRQREVDLQATQAELVQFKAKKEEDEFERFAENEIHDDRQTGPLKIPANPETDENHPPVSKTLLELNACQKEQVDDKETESSTKRKHAPYSLREKRKPLDEKVNPNPPKKPTIRKKPAKVVVDRANVNEAEPGDCKTQ
jgi:hypothetical protein